MPNRAVGLTDAKIQGLRPPVTGQVEIPDKLLPGLRVRIGKTGTRTFVLRKRVAGRMTNMSLGRYNCERFGLADARKKARALIEEIEAGRDPSKALKAARRDGPDAGRVRVLWNRYIEQEVRGKKRTGKEVERVGKKHILPAIGDRQADSITRADITALVEAVHFRNPSKPTPREARHVHQRLSAFYSWAMPRLDRLPANPCRDAAKPGPSTPRERVLSQDEIKAFWSTTEKLGWPFGAGFRLLLLTAQRRSEVFEAAWDEVQGSTWTIPRDRAKNGVTHVVPLARPAQAIIKTLPRIADTRQIFPSGKDPLRSASGFTKAHTRLLGDMAKALGVEAIERFTLHDLRRTAATHMQRLGIDLVVVEAILNHVSGSRAGVAGIYARYRYDLEKREALDAWASDVLRIAAGKPEPKRRRR
jgi:integrase